MSETPTREADVRTAFARQAEISPGLGSPFMGLLCGVLGQHIDRSTAVGCRVLDWEGQPDSLHDALPLRLTGALHLLVRRGVVPELAALYPPNTAPDADSLWAAIAPVLESQQQLILSLLDNPPQTNETGRSGPLMAGLLTIAAETGLPLSLYELGASAGLNLNLGQFAYDLGGRIAGDSASAVLIHPDWTGPAPPRADVRIIASQGVDQSPLDATRDGELLTAYVWPDQADRLARVIAAIDIAKNYPPRVAKADAADWLETALALEGEHGIVRVVMHTIAYQYFPGPVQARIRAHLSKAGAKATPNTPLAWLSYENEPGHTTTSLRLMMWPGGGERLLGLGHPHGKNFEMF